MIIIDPRKLGPKAAIVLGTVATLSHNKDYHPLSIEPKNIYNDVDFSHLTLSSLLPVLKQSLYTESNFDIINRTLPNIKESTFNVWHNTPDAPMPSITNTTPNIGDDVWHHEPDLSTPAIDTAPNIENLNQTLTANNLDDTLKPPTANIDSNINKNSLFDNMKTAFISLGVVFTVPAFALGLNKLEHEKLSDIVKLIFNINKYNIGQNINQIIDDTLSMLDKNSTLARYLENLKKLDLHNICSKYINNRFSALDILIDFNTINNNILHVSKQQHVLKASAYSGISMIGSGMVCLLFCVTTAFKIGYKKILATSFGQSLSSAYKNISNFLSLIRKYTITKIYNRFFKKQ